MKTKHILGLLMVLAAACKDKDNTVIIVEVWSDVAVPSGLNAIRIDVTGPTASISKRYQLSSQSQLPIHLALVPEDSDDASLMVKATGLYGEHEFVSQAAWVAFVPGEGKLLRLNLESLCASVICNANQSCTSGFCSTVPRVSSLPDYDPAVSPPTTGGAGGFIGGAGGNGGFGGATIGTGGTIVPFGGTPSTGGSSPTIISTIGGIAGAGGSAGNGGTISIGGTKSSGGSTSSSTGSCPSVAACGGDLVGTWNVTSSCLKLDGEFLTRGTGMGCDRAKVTGSLQVKGAFVATADKKFQDKTTTTGSVTVALDRQCLFMSGTWTQCDLISVAVEGLGFRNVRCTTAADGGCTCPGTIDHPGNMGLIVAEPETYGTYTTSGTTFMTGENPLTGAPLEYSYCAGSGVLIASPKTSSPPTKGTIEFQKFSGTGGTGGSSGVGAAGGSTSTVVPALPCEIVAQDGGGAKCVTAHSTVRTIVPGYSGPLYLLCQGSTPAGPGTCNGVTLEIFAKDGYADVEKHDAFCGSETCTIRKIYDQSGQKNDLEPAPKGGAKATPDNPAKASALPVMINGHKAYGVLIKAGMGYRTGCNGCTIKKTNGMPLNDEPQTVYMVTSQKDLIDGCCFDYGNAETTSNDDGNGAVEAVYFGGGVVWGTGYGGKPGPWVMADLENGTYAGWENRQDKSISTNKPLKFDYVTAVLVGDTADKNNGKGRFALYGADAQGLDASLGKLTCMYDGIRPEKTGYVPMQKQGSLILGTGGDNSSGGGGRFYEGATIAGPALSNAALSRLHDAIVAAKYENAN
jgi:hypothetical protein